MVALPLRRIIVAKPILDWLGRVDRKALAGESFDMMTVVFLLKVAFLGILKRKHSECFVVVQSTKQDDDEQMDSFCSSLSKAASTEMMQAASTMENPHFRF